MLILSLLLILQLLKTGVQAANLKGQNKWFVIETEQEQNLDSKKPLFNIMMQKTSKGNKFEIKTIKKKKMNTEILKSANMVMNDILAEDASAISPIRTGIATGSIEFF